MVVDERGLGELQHEAARREPGMIEDIRDNARQAGIAQLARRDVDADVERLVGRAPLRGCRARGTQHPFAERDNQRRLLGERYELARRQDSEPRVLPAHERLEPDDVERRQRDDGLELEQQLVVLDRSFELASQLQLRVRVPSHRLVEDDVLVLALTLRGVQRDVGIAQEIDLSDAVIGDGDTDARLHRDREVVDFDGQVQDVQ